MEKRFRALVGVGMYASYIAIATDDPSLEQHCQNDVDDLNEFAELDNAGVLPAGLYLGEFTSTVEVWRNGHGEDDVGPLFTDWKFRPVKPEELAELLAMRPAAEPFESEERDGPA